MNKSIRRILIGTVLFLMGVMILLAILILTKTVCINKMFVSDDDIIGVDVSEYQDKIDMKRLSEQNIDFVYINFRYIYLDFIKNEDKYFLNIYDNFWFKLCSLL